MSRFRKKVKEYERWILVGVVVVILATISISGMGPTRCGRPTGAEDLSGSFEVAPGRRVAVSSDEFLEVHRRYSRFHTFFGPSIRYGGLLEAQPGAREQHEVWKHIVLVEAAKAAGYRVTDRELADGIRSLINRMMERARGVGGGDPYFLYDVKEYDRIVAKVYGGTKPDFEATFREVMLKDKLIAPLADAARLATPRTEAYEAWKTERERVDLAYVAVAAAQFEEAVRLVEETRTAIAARAEALRHVAAAAQQVRTALSRADQWKAAHGGAPPADQAELEKAEPGRPAFSLGSDGWGRPYRYEKRGDAAWVWSTGADADAPGDDVTPDVLRAIQASAALQAVGTALVEWHGATKAFPESLDLLTTVPPAGEGVRPVPPLSAVPKDPWGRDLVYAREGPVLLSTGVDGERGTADDLVAEVAPTGATVPLPPALAPYVGDAKDAWGRPLRVRPLGVGPWTFEVASAGPDGTFGTDDDVRDGNARDLEDFFRTEAADHREPARRRVEAVWVLFPLVPDEIFQQAWERFPQYRPVETKESDEAFQRFASNEQYYQAYQVENGRIAKDAQGKPIEIDPADPEKGHGASVVPKDVKKAWLVPAPETLGDRKDVAIRPDDPQHDVYVRRGWRRILLREQFFENLLNDWLKRARDSHAAVEAWEKTDKSTPRPEEVTFTTLLAGVADLRPGSADEAAGARFLEYVDTKEALSREELEKLPAFDDLQVHLALDPLSKPGEYPSRTPTVVHNSAGRMIVRNLELQPERQKGLGDPGVREAVWPRYLGEKRMDRAVAELHRVAEAAQPPAPAGAPAGEEPTKPRPIEEAAAEVGKARGFAWTSGTTGMFVGNARTPPLRIPPGTPEEEKAALTRAHVVRRDAYPRVLPLGGAEKGATVGAITREPVRDEGKDSTESAYLAQVRAREDAPPEEFDAERYATWLRTAAFGAEPEGSVRQTLRRFFDWRELRTAFDLRTTVPDPKPPVDPRRRP